MKKKTPVWVRLFAILFILILLVIAGVWGYLRSRTKQADNTPISPVMVFLLTPTSGSDVQVGDFVPVTLKAVAPADIQSSEIFVDGKSLGVVSDNPGEATWTWQALKAGVHSLYALAIAGDGQVGQSQTVIVNVLAGSGMLQIQANGTQSLTQIGQDYGVSPDQMAGANPHLDPNQTLPDGQPVQVPNGGGEPGSQPSAGNGLETMSILWEFKLNEPVDKSYCYISSGGGVWQKMPREPFQFFQGQDNFYTQMDLNIPQQVNVVQMQCWGWAGEALKYLGEASTSFDINQPTAALVATGQGFHFIGTPTIPIPVEKLTGGGKKSVPPPFAVREATNAADCTAHGNPLLAPFICNTLLNAQLKQYYILEWEWKPESCWPGFCKYGIDAIDGYRIYLIDQYKSVHYMKEISNPNQKVTAIPLPWGNYCYAVQAYVNDPAIEASEKVSFCPGESPAPDKITLTPTNWLTTGDLSEQWYNTFGNPPEAVVVSASNYGNEYRSSAGVRFFVQEKPLPGGAVYQKAVLKFSILWTNYFAHGMAGNANPLCVASVAKAIQDWTGMDGGENHYVGGNNTLAGSAYNTSFISLPEYVLSPLEIDVTSLVKDWIKNPSQNHGFIFVPRHSPETSGEGGSECDSGLGNFQLEIYYFAP